MSNVSLHMPRCNDFSELTERAFGGFFAAHGFRRIGDPQYFGEDRKAGGPLCAWFFASEKCRFKFYHGDGEINLLVGEPNAPLSRLYEDSAWRYIRSIVKTTNRPPGPSKNYEGMIEELLQLVESNYPAICEAIGGYAPQGVSSMNSQQPNPSVKGTSCGKPQATP